MDEIERGFRIIGNALEKGKFTKLQLEFIGQFCDSVKGSTNKVLARIAAPKLSRQRSARICLECGGTGQNDSPPGKYHGLCHTCSGTGKRDHRQNAATSRSAEVS